MLIIYNKDVVLIKVDRLLKSKQSKIKREKFKNIFDFSKT